MKFEPGEKYLYRGGALLGHKDTEEATVTYIGVSATEETMAVVEYDLRLFFVQFTNLFPIKKKQRFFVQFPKKPELLQDDIYAALVGKDPDAIRNYLDEFFTREDDANYHRYIEVETVEPQDPL